ncbi:hypothetical protein L7F22_068087 [Adiantum nelumboides]|nr:hypothetical protein [Adiantum nelumboides]
MTASSANVADPSSTALGSTIFARLHPTTYLARFLDNAIRPDGRSFDAFRDVSVGVSTIETAQGSAIVRYGNSTIIAGVKGEFIDISDEEDVQQTADIDEAEENEMQTDKQKSSRSIGLGPIDKRSLVVGVDLTPMSSARFKSGPPGEEAQVLASRLMRSFEVCPPFSADSLNVQGSSLRWCLFVDLVCLSYDGNLLDACTLAVNSALNDTKLPNAQFDDQGLICSSEESEAKPLSLRSFPQTFTFGIVEGTHLLSDPNAFESTMISASITITLDSMKLGTDEDLVGVQCSGRCSALITTEEARQAEVNGRKEGSSNNLRIQDEELAKVCLIRARRHCAQVKKAMQSAQR